MIICIQKTQWEGDETPKPNLHMIDDPVLREAVRQVYQFPDIFSTEVYLRYILDEKKYKVNAEGRERVILISDAKDDSALLATLINAADPFQWDIFSHIEQMYKDSHALHGKNL